MTKMNQSSTFFLIAFSVISFAIISEGALYDYKTSKVFTLKSDNFDKQINKNRDKGVTVIHYY